MQAGIQTRMREYALGAHDSKLINGQDPQIADPLVFFPVPGSYDDARSCRRSRS